MWILMWSIIIDYGFVFWPEVIPLRHFNDGFGFSLNKTLIDGLESHVVDFCWLFPMKKQTH